MTAPRIGAMVYFPWTDDQIARLKFLWRQGYSASQVAKDLGGGLTRSAVIGKVHRVGLSGRAQPAKPGATVSASRRADSDAARGAVQKLKIATDKRAHNRPTVKPPKLAQEFGTASRPKSEPKAPTPINDDASAPRLAESTRYSCKWPLGNPDEPDFGWCSHEKQAGSPYCLGHTRMAYTAAPKPINKRADPSRELERSLRRWIGQ